MPSGLPTGFSGGSAFYAEMLAVADSLIQEYGMVAALRGIIRRGASSLHGGGH